jgi:hypothetical protein
VGSGRKSHLGTFGPLGLAVCGRAVKEGLNETKLTQVHDAKYAETPAYLGLETDAAN